MRRAREVNSMDGPPEENRQRPDVEGLARQEWKESWLR